MREDLALAPDHTSSDALTHTVQLLSAAVLGAHKKETREEEYYRKHPARQKLDFNGLQSNKTFRIAKNTKNYRKVHWGTTIICNISF